MVSFGNLSTTAGLKELNDYLLTRSYIDGFQASRDDLAVYSALSAAPDSNVYPHAARWFAHVTALLGASFPGKGSGVTIAGAAVSATGGAAAAKPAAADDDDDDVDILQESDDDDDDDLFGEMTEEEKKRKEVIAAKKAKSAEKAKLSKSMVIMDIKPWDDTTDLAKMEEYVRSITYDGLLWGQCKQVAVGFGIKKLQMTTVIEDAKVESIDIIIEDDLVQDGENEFIQSVDIVAFNKL
eukprot:TRINITY_DN49994_c0_g1_i1.p1 TRINITY_DN49994_c0_g1~~TRINITY_DN49994_c0_g1_i1.p1  ORF type:complete len:278 (-),score=72.66 TRINITY_DN49994_c0_g1_i1:196-912(-)